MDPSELYAEHRFRCPGRSRSRSGGRSAGCHVVTRKVRIGGLPAMDKGDTAASVLFARAPRVCARTTPEASGPGLDQARLVSGDNHLGPVAQRELGQHSADVGLHRLFGYVECGGDLGVGEPAGH